MTPKDFRWVDKSEIGLKLLLFCLSFFLKTGVTCASFHLLGKVPLERDMLQIFVSTGEMAVAMLLSSRLLMLSGPFALEMSRFFNIFSVSFVST